MDRFINKSRKDSKKENASAFKVGMWYTICNFLTSALSFLTLPLFTRLLSKNDFGDYSVIISWISILAPIVTLNLYSSVTLAKFDFRDKYNQYIAAVALLGFGVTAVVYFLAICFKSSVLSLLGIPIYALHMIFIYLLFSPAMDILQARFRAEMRYIPIIILTVLSAVMSTGTALVTTFFAEDKLSARLFGTYIPFVVIDIILFLYILKRGKGFQHGWMEYCQYGLSISVPLVIHYLASTIMNSSDRIMIQKMCSAEDVAVYSVAYSCAAMVNLLRNSLNGAWTPWTYTQLEEEKKDNLKKYTYYYILLFGIICLGIIAVAPEVIYIAGGKAYAMAKFVIPPVVMGYIFSMLYGLYSNVEQYYKKQKWFVPFAMISALSNLILNYIFIPIFGYIAAAYTTMVSCGIECMLHYWNVRRMGLAGLYNTRFNIVFVIIAVCITALSNLLYIYNWVRYMLIAGATIAVVTVGIVNRDVIMGKIKNLKKC